MRRRNRTSEGDRSPSRRAAAGFTVVEMLVTVTILALVIVGVLSLFDMNTRITRVQTDLAELQQSLRVGQYDLVRMTRMAGRGGLPVGPLPTGWAISVETADGNTYIDPGDTFKVMPQTDVLTMRGVFTSPIYSISEGNFTVDIGAGTGQMTVTDPAATSVPQRLTALCEAIDEGRPEGLIITSPLDDAIYHVVELDPNTSDTTQCTAASPSIVVGFLIDGGTHTAGYTTLSGGVYNPQLTAAATVGILEEYRYYVEEDYLVPGDDQTDLRPRLTRARVYPGTETPHAGSNANWSVDMADNVLDLQVALGFDLGDDGFIVDNTDADEVVTDSGDDTDEWLFNADADDPADPAWTNLANRLYYVRVSTLAITPRRDPGYEIDPAVELDELEDRQYTTATDDPLYGTDRRQYRHRTLQTTVDLRNIS